MPEKPHSTSLTTVACAALAGAGLSAAAVLYGHRETEDLSNAEQRCSLWDQVEIRLAREFVSSNLIKIQELSEKKCEEEGLACEVKFWGDIRRNFSTPYVYCATQDGFETSGYFGLESNGKISEGEMLEPAHPGDLYRHDPGSYALYPEAFGYGTCVLAGTVLHEEAHVISGELHVCIKEDCETLKRDWITIAGEAAQETCENKQPN